MKRPREGWQAVVDIVSALALGLYAHYSLAQSVIQAPAGAKHPYDIALDYCASRGGWAQYSVQRKVVRFSCGEEPSKVLSIES